MTKSPRFSALVIPAGRSSTNGCRRRVIPRPSDSRDRCSRRARSLDFSFSGLKTAVLYHVRGVPGKHQTPPPLNDRTLRDICASFQAACIDTIVLKLKRAMKQTRAKSIIIGGGVSANRGLREAMQNFPLPALFPAFEYCTDNAAMSGGLAHLLLQKKQTASLDLDAITSSQFALS